MGYWASGCGNATLNSETNTDDILKMLDTEKENDTFSNDVLYAINANKVIEFSYSDTHYDEGYIMPFLELLSPFITEGDMYMDGEGEDHWCWIFDPKNKQWNENTGEVVYGGLESYDDNDLIKELKRRGYSVRKVSKKRA